MHTPENIESLEPNQIFVFGSNLNGEHFGGAAKTAHEKFGAEWGVGEGLTGQCYAFPTLGKNMKKITTEELQGNIERFEKCTKENTDKMFLLTRIGCGIAGYSEPYISSGFVDMPKNVIKPEGW